MSKDHESIYKALGARILQQRRSRGMTIEELARRSKLSQGNLSEIEQGKRDPRFSTLSAIAGGLGMSLLELLDIRKGKHLVSMPTQTKRNGQKSQS